MTIEKIGRASGHVGGDARRLRHLGGRRTGRHRHAEPSPVRTQGTACSPTRSAGGTRLYSANDVIRLSRIIDLLDAGLNLAGVAMVLDLQDDNTRMRNEISNSLHRDENNGGSPENNS